MNIENSLRQYLDIQIETYLMQAEKNPKQEPFLYSEVAIVKSCLDYCFIELSIGQLDAISKINKIHYRME